MIQKFYQFAHRELSFEAVIDPKSDKRHNLFRHLIAVYLISLLTFIFLTGRSLTLPITLPLSLFMLIDFTLGHIFHKKSLIKMILDEYDRMNMKALESYKRKHKISFKSFSEGIEKVYDAKIMIFLKSLNLDICRDYDKIQSIFNSWEKREFDRIRWRTKVIRIAADTFFTTVLVFYLPLGKLQEILESIAGDTSVANEWNVKITILVIGVGIVYTLVRTLTHIISRLYLESKSRKMRLFQKRLEEMYWSKRK